jgi:hypothetical protein
MSENTRFGDIVWYTCPTCKETYDRDCWDNCSSCICCGAPKAKKEKEIDMILGMNCKDTVSGFIGVAVATHHYLHGCVRVTLQPPIDKEGKLPESQNFDEPQLTILDEVVQVGDRSTGGPEKYPDVRRYG